MSRTSTVHPEHAETSDCIGSICTTQISHFEYPNRASHPSSNSQMVQRLLRTIILDHSHSKFGSPWDIPRSNPATIRPQYGLLRVQSFECPKMCLDIHKDRGSKLHSFTVEYSDIHFSKTNILNVQVIFGR
jgi:hypothetical protein